MNQLSHTFACRLDEPHHAPSDKVAVSLAAALLRLHETMAVRIGSHLIADPTLAMLLELFVAQSADRPVTIKVLALSSGVPQSTALRWIDRLEAEGLLIKTINCADRRSAHVTLTDRALDLIEPVLLAFSREAAITVVAGNQGR